MFEQRKSNLFWFVLHASEVWSKLFETSYIVYIIGALYILVTKGYRRGWKTQKTRLARNTRRHTWRHTLVRGQMGPPLNRDVRPAVGTWRRLPMGLLSFLFVSPYSLFLWPCIVAWSPPLHRWLHKVRRNKIKLLSREFPFPRTHAQLLR